MPDSVPAHESPADRIFGNDRGRNLTAGPSIINVIGDLLTDIGELKIFIFGRSLLGRESEFAVFDCFFSQII